MGTSTQLELTAALAAEMPSTFAPRAKALYPAIWRCLRRFGVPEPDLDDALQAVLLALHRRWAHLEALPKADLQNYACCVATSVARRAARTRQRFASVPLEEDLVEGVEDPESRAESSEALAKLDAILAKFEPDEPRPHGRGSRASFFLSDSLSKYPQTVRVAALLRRLQ